MDDKVSVQTIDNHIYFYTDFIDNESCLDLIKTIRELDNNLRHKLDNYVLYKDEPPVIPIWLHVSSPGGYLYFAFSVADNIKQIKTPIYSVAEGSCASSATVITMACKKRFIQPSAVMLIHQFRTRSEGKFEELQDDMKNSELAMKSLIDFYKRNTNLSEKKLSKLLQRDMFFSAEECIKMGFADELMV